MKLIENSLNKLTDAMKYLSAITLFLMAVHITYSVFMRALNNPVMGDYVIVQLMMVILVMSGLPYTQKENAHISVGIIVNRFSDKTQTIFNIAAYMLTFLVCILIGLVNVVAAIDRFSTNRTVDLINIPIYPFTLIIGVGFLLWGLMALFQVILSIKKLVKGGAV